MDISSLMSTLLSADALTGMSQATGNKESDVQSVLGSALPLLLQGASAQAQDAEASGFANALAQHAAVDTSNLSSFLGNVDLEDGAKIVGHLLGSGNNQTASVAQQAGVSTASAGNIMAAAAPLLMSLLGKQQQSTQSSASSLMGSLLGNVDLGSLITGMLGGSQAPAAPVNQKKESQSLLATILGKLFK